MVSKDDVSVAGKKGVIQKTENGKAHVTIDGKDTVVKTNEVSYDGKKQLDEENAKLKEEALVRKKRIREEAEKQVKVKGKKPG